MAALMQRTARAAATAAVAPRQLSALMRPMATLVSEYSTDSRSFSSQAQMEGHMKDGKVMHESLLNANILNTQYAVRGELYLKAEALRRAGKQIIFTKVGNPHALGQTPLTFNR